MANVVTKSLVDYSTSHTLCWSSTHHPCLNKRQPRKDQTTSPHSDMVGTVH